MSYLLAREDPLTSRIVPRDEQKEPAAGSSSSHQGRRVSFGTVPDFAYQGTGVRVDSTVPDSPAERAGVLPGDVLIRLNGQEIGNLRAFSKYLKTLDPGQAVEATLIRDGTERTLNVIVEDR